jgi:hypothetical protein
MKEFEKYWDFTGLSEHINLVREDGSYERVPNFNLKQERAEGWRAALECVRNKICQKTWHPDSNVRDFIDYELGKNESSDAVSGLSG